MASNRNAFEKRAREKAKHERAAAKRERRQQRADDDAESDDAAGGSSDQEGVLAELAALHQAFDDGGMSFEDFEARRDELLERLQVD